MAAIVQDKINYAVDTAKRTFGSAPPTDAYLKWDSPEVEVIQQDEPRKTQEIVKVMNRMQQHNFDKHRHAFRATHVKTQGVVKGTLKVNQDLPTHLQQGIFSEPGKEYNVVARYANEPYLLQDDKEPGPRGMAIKVFGVSGEPIKLDSDSSNYDSDLPQSQDFMFNNAPMLELTDIDTTLEIMSLREKHFDNPTALGAALKFRTDQIKQHGPYQLPNTNIIGHSMFTQSAFRFGDYYGHIGMFPVTDAQKKKEDETVSKNDAYGVLGDWLFDYFKGQEAVYDVKIQLGTSTLHHPTEDASIVWSEDTAPYQSIGTLTFPAQNSFDHARRTFWEDKMSLSPWRPGGLEAHRPLGSVNRLRKAVYAASREQRDRINVKESKGDVKWEDIP